MAAASNPEELLIAPTPIPTQVMPTPTPFSTTTTSSSTTTTLACTYQANVRSTITVEGVPVLSGSLPYTCLAQVVQNCLNALGADLTGYSLVTRRLSKTNLRRLGVTYTPAQENYFKLLSLDECVAGYFLGQGTRGIDWTHNAQLSADPSRGNVFIDESCKLVNTGRMCGVGDVRYAIGTPTSPLSLVWDIDLAAIADQGTYVQFPLDPKDQDKWSLWKASSHLPLVVYDPEHKGIINSASQLFGNYSFGRYFSDGYQALKTLEVNGDNKLSGSELDALALWFDENQNGISEQGEVRSLKSESVTALYYTPDQTSSYNGEASAKLGFERIVNDKQQSGASIDWRTKTFTNKPLLESQILNSPTTDKVSGPWYFKVTKSSGGVAIGSKGLIVLRNHRNVLDGHTYVQTPLVNNQDKAAYAVRFLRLEGEFNRLGSNAMTFRVEDPEHSLLTKTIATLNDKSKTLNGESTVNDIKNGQSYTYKWVAYREPA